MYKINGLKKETPISAQWQHDAGRHQRGAGAYPRLITGEPDELRDIRTTLIYWRKRHRKKLENGNKRQRIAARTLKNCRKSHRCETRSVSRLHARIPESGGPAKPSRSCFSGPIGPAARSSRRACWFRTVSWPNLICMPRSNGFANASADQIFMAALFSAGSTFR